MEAITKYPWGKGKIVYSRDATANDSDKSFTVPDGKIWLLKLIYVELTATATAGNRQIIYTISNGTNVIIVSYSSAAATAGQTTICAYVFGTGSARDTTTRRLTTALTTAANVCIMEGSMPELLLPEGYIVRVLDATAVDPAADDMTVTLHYIEYDA